MILLDPDLDSHPAALSSAARRSTVSASSTPPRSLKLPSVRALSRFLTAAKAAVGLRGQVTVLLTTDGNIRGLNRKFRGKNKATDVLSFPAKGVGAEAIAGDLAISVSTARRQGAAHGHPLGVELKVLMLHGLLHLAGYDHEKDEGRMARRERLLRGKLGLPQGLIERADEPKETARRQTPGNLSRRTPRGVQR